MSHQRSIAIVSFIDSSDPSQSCHSPRAAIHRHRVIRIAIVSSIESGVPTAESCSLPLDLHVRKHCGWQRSLCFPRSGCPQCIPLQWLILMR